MTRDKSKNRRVKTEAKAKAKKSKANNIKTGIDPKNMIASPTVQNTNKIKIKLPIRVTVIILSVLALSWLFEGWRQIHNGLTVSHIAVFIGGIVATVILLWVQAFWIYLEEKYKGTLRKKIEHFEKLEAYWQRKKNRDD